LNQASEPTDR